MEEGGFWVRENERIGEKCQNGMKQRETERKAEEGEKKRVFKG